MYGKIFASIYEGTLADHWKALVTFQQMIVLCNEDGTIDMTPSAISRVTGIPLEIIKEGIECLEKDDPGSRTPKENGKRIIRIDDHRDWGWRIVNHGYYKRLASWEDKKRADRERIAEKRNKNKCVANCSGVSQKVADVAHTNTDTNTKNNMSDKFLSDAENIYNFYIKHVPLENISGLKQPCLNNLKQWLKEYSQEELLDSIKNYSNSRVGQKPRFNKKPSNFFGRSGDSRGFFKGFLNGVYQSQECAEGLNPPPANLDPETRYQDC